MNRHLWKYSDEEWASIVAGLSPENLGWAAGFFDGEGCIAAGRSKKPKNREAWFNVRLQIMNTNRQALERFQEMFHGSLCTRRLIPGRRQMYELRLDGKIGERCLAALVPHLTVKRTQAAAALEMRLLLTSHDPRKKQGVPRVIYRRLSFLLDQIRQANGRSYQTPQSVSDAYVEV